MSNPVTILDGPTGTLLAERGVPTPLPGWSAHAIETHPDIIRDIHAEYADAGATVHTACTFRTTPRAVGDKWKDLAAKAIDLAREGSRGGRVAASIAPLADCYRPDLSPVHHDIEAARSEFTLLANHFVSCLEDDDILLVETFPQLDEFGLAVESAVTASCGRQHIDVWASLTPGYRADLLSPDDVEVHLGQAIAAGASAVLVNCVPAARALEYVSAARAAAEPTGIPFGIYANAGHANDQTGWTTDPIAVSNYADLAEEWAAAGATIIGGCCGTGPAHIRELARRFGA